jgi:PHD/YefM family antitoxin component YafN of YafNO toxin-antitoxin module
MRKYLTITEAQQQLPKWPEDLASEPAIITKDGKPAIIALSFKQFESLLETIEILSDREFMTQLRCGIQQAQRGETIDLQQLKADLNFDSTEKWSL